MSIATAGLLLSLSLATKSPSSQCAPYLLFPPEFNVSEITQLGPLPIVGGEYLMQKYAKKIIETQFSIKNNACLEPLSEDAVIRSKKYTEYMALLRRIMLSVNTHLQSDDDFFEDRKPDFRLGTQLKFADERLNKFKYGLMYTLTQYYFTDVPTQWINGAEYSQGFILSLCVIELSDGDIDYCLIYRAPDETLLHRAGYFEKDKFYDLVQEILSEPEYIAYKTDVK